MDFERLEKNICDNVLEAQLKLGYDKRPISFNYTLSTLRNLLATDADTTDMQYALFQFRLYSEPALGELSFHEIKDGFCITVPEKGTENIHTLYDHNVLIPELVNKVREHCSSVDEVLDIFRKYSDDAVIEKKSNDEFDYLVYFKNGVPDEYYYCISVEEEIDGSLHVSYHRFIKEDYEELGF